MTRRDESDVDPRLISELFVRPVDEEEYRRKRAVMTRWDGWRFRRCAKFLTRLARKMEAAR